MIALRDLKVGMHVIVSNKKRYKVTHIDGHYVDTGFGSRYLYHIKMEYSGLNKDEKEISVEGHFSHDGNCFEMETGENVDITEFDGVETKKQSVNDNYTSRSVNFPYTKLLRGEL